MKDDANKLLNRAIEIFKNKAVLGSWINGNYKKSFNIDDNLKMTIISFGIDLNWQYGSSICFEINKVPAVGVRALKRGNHIEQKAYYLHSLMKQCESQYYKESREKESKERNEKINNYIETIN